jgi:hypothetical protein
LLDKIPEFKDAKIEWTDKEDSEILFDEMNKQVKTETVMFPEENKHAVNFYRGKEPE